MVGAIILLQFTHSYATVSFHYAKSLLPASLDPQADCSLGAVAKHDQGVGRAWWGRGWGGLCAKYA